MINSLIITTIEKMHDPLNLFEIKSRFKAIQLTELCLVRFKSGESQLL